LAALLLAPSIARLVSHVLFFSSPMCFGAVCLLPSTGGPMPTLIRGGARACPMALERFKP
jgi:hypothetical protein